ncbi:hypothetical protein [Lutibacter sp.]|uniref:hypothetical protein n=1 Tax=Lutibacter sp. TaxID=1925666 RepID=UPI001A253369|nr:hypothetical protein [Lutibacter sp.]MBI9040449.1 hypothetical protein [Lutibacter sp.]
MKTLTQKFRNLKNSKTVTNILKNAIGLSVIFLFGSCMPDNEVEPFQPQPDGQALNERFLDNRNDAVQEFIIDASVGGTVIGAQGTKVQFQANSFGINGVPVTGNVTVQLLEIYDKASMLLKNKSTLGQRPNGDKEVLKSAGEFFIDAKQGTNELELLENATVTSREIDPANVDGAMQIFKTGGLDNDCDGIDDDCDWVEADDNGDGINDKPVIRDGQNTTGGSYVTYGFDISSFGWTNLDRWYSFTGPKTEIYVDVPAGYNGDNCAVYLSYDGEPTALAKMDIWDTTTEMFTEHYGLIPIGQQVHIIVVTEIDGELHYAIQGTTVIDNHIEIITSLSPITQAALESLINGLP